MTDQTVVPATCPIRWSIRSHRGHWRTDRQACRPGLQHVALIAGITLIRKPSEVQVFLRTTDEHSTSALEPGHDVVVTADYKRYRADGEVLARCMRYVTGPRLPGAVSCRGPSR